MIAPPGLRLIQISAEEPQSGNMAVMATNTLKRDIIVIVSIKLTIVLISALFVFGPSQRPRIDLDAVSLQILNHPTVSDQER
jgi:hypothetical protein